MLATGGRAGAADAFAEPDVAEARRLHDASIAGSKDDVERAEAFLTAAIARSSSPAVLQCFLGSLLTVKSSKAFPGPSKLRYLKEGIRAMDAAVEAAPRDPAVRFVRAMNSQMLPSFCARRDAARADFRVLVEQIGAPEVAARFDEATLQAIYYYAGLAFKKSKEPAQAREAWERGFALGEATPLGAKISRELDRIRRGQT